MYKRIVIILVFLVFLMISISVIFAESDAVQDESGDSIRIINVKVIWNDDGQTNNRPDSVTIRLLHDDGGVDSVILNESNFLNDTFIIHDNGGYEVEEIGNLSSYSVSLTGDVDNGFVITNTINQAPNNGSDDMIVDENSTDNSSDDVNDLIDDGSGDSNHAVDQDNTKYENQTENISPAQNTTYNNADKEKQVIKKENKSVKKNNTNMTDTKLKNTGLPVVALVVVLFIILIIPLSRWKK